MAKNFRKWKQAQNQEIKQIVADANIFGYTDKATTSVLEQKTGIKISHRTLTRINAQLKKNPTNF